MRKYILGFALGIASASALAAYSVDHPVLGWSLWTPGQHEQLQGFLTALVTRLHSCGVQI